MIKTIPLMKASLKGFMRNWKTVVLLIVFPLLVISILFLSFNPKGLGTIPVGVVAQPAELEQLDAKAFSFLDVNLFDTIEECKDRIRRYDVYVCIEMKQDKAIILNVHFDNTREPIIWMVIARIEQAVDLVQKKKSREIASDFLSRFRQNMVRVEEYKQEIKQTNRQIDGYIDQADESINDLEDAQYQLSVMIDNMDEDISDVKSTKNQLQETKDNFYNQATSSVNRIDNNIEGYEYPFYIIQDEAAFLTNELKYYNSVSDSYFNDVDYRISRYEESSEKGKEFEERLDDKVDVLNEVKIDLLDSKEKLYTAEDELQNIQDEFEIIQDLDADVLVDPIVVRNKAAYVPEISEKLKERYKHLADGDQTELIVRGINLISLQTIFPKLLLLITMFLSLLISSFMCLSEINSSAQTRVRLVRWIFLHEFVSIFLSTFIIIAIPVTCVLLLGNFLFLLPIYSNAGSVAIIMSLLIASFVLVGLALAYAIKKESITLLISTFVLIFLIFFSGFLLPIERMSYFAGLAASNFPGYYALAAFNKVVFYGQGFSALQSELLGLVLWVSGLLVLVLIIKKLRQV